MKNKDKIRILSIILACVIAFTSMPVFASDETRNEDTSEGSAYWENYEWTESEFNDINGEDVDERTIGSLPYGFKGGTLSGGTWKHDSTGWWYELPGGWYPTNGWYQIDGYWYFFYSNGYMATGWISDGGYWYYCDSNGKMLTGWITVSGKQYFMNSSGQMQYGWVNTSGNWYYCSESTGEWINNSGTQMCQTAFSCIGNPYVWGGTSLTNGADCSGLVMTIHGLHGYSIQRTAQAQYNGSNKISSQSSLQPGDLVFYGSSSTNIGHVAIYVGKVGGDYNQIIHAANSSQGIIRSSISSNSSNRYYGTYWR